MTARSRHTLFVATLSSVALATLSTGCRIGNYTSPPPENPDKISGYYDTDPESLKFCATAGADTQCVDAPTGEIPYLLSAELTSPTALIIQDFSTGDAIFTAPHVGKSALPVWVNPDKSLYYTASTSPEVLWEDSSCTVKLYLTENGAILPGGGNLVSGGGKTVGRIQLKATVTHVFDDTCGPSLQAMSACYQDIEQCGGGSATENQYRQERVQDTFGIYIKAKAMAGTDIPNIKNLGYEVQYQ